MRTNNMKAILKAALRVVCILPFAAAAALGQQQVNLTAGPANATLPDGSVVPMWGYSCTALAAGVTSTATCAPLNPAATLTTPAGWSPVVITVPTGQALTINLTNSLSFLNGNTVPTSLVIVGQLGGGLGTTATSTPSPDHSNAQSVTWPIADPTTTGTPPSQGARVQSFSTEVAFGATTALTFGSLTNPLKPGTYLIESGTHPSIQAPMGLYGILVVTTAPTSATAAGTAYPAVGTVPAITYNAEIPLLLSEIDPVQNNAVNTAVNTAGFSESATIPVNSAASNNISRCIDGAAAVAACYPPAVNYSPLYYLFNGVAFNKTIATTATTTNPSLFPTLPATGLTPGTGTVLVRFVNAGLRMHVPSIVGSLTGTPAVSGFSLIAEDGNPLPGVPRVQSEVFMAAGKTYDVMVNVPAVVGTALPVFDRQLSLSGNAIARDAGMLAYIGINGAGLPAAPAFAAAVARPDTYNSVIAGQTLTVSDPSKGLIANDTNVFGVQVVGTVAGLTLYPNGTFAYLGAPTTFTYCANGSVTGTVCSSNITATVTLGACTAASGCLEAASGIVMNPITYTSKVATSLSIKSPGILSVDKDNAGYPLTVAASSVAPAGSGWTLSVDNNGGFNASVPAAGTYTFTYKAQNSQGTLSASTATVTLVFPAANGPHVTVVDGVTKALVTVNGAPDYRWLIEEDRTFYVDPACTTNPPPAGCPSATTGIVPTFGTNFHTSYMPIVARGCVGTLSCESGQTVLGAPAVCDVGNGACRTTGSQETAVDPSQVHLDITKRYYLTILPGDGADALDFNPQNHAHGMGGTPLAWNATTSAWISPGVTPAGQSSVTVLVEPTPLQPAKLSVFVFEDDFPLNGEQDGGGGIDVLSPNEAGLGSFQITLFDDAGGSGDATGQPTYDMFNMPLSNSLAGQIDPATGNDACPISPNSRTGIDTSTGTPGGVSPTGITGMIVTCPKYESDGRTLSPLAGQAIVANLYPGRYGVVATPSADRIARGEEWLQTNTLDGQKAHDSFLRVGEPGFFQEYGPAGYHVSIGFANPKIINDRKAGVCGGTDPTVTGTNCTNSITGTVTTERMSRTPDERLYSSGDNSSFAFTQCYVSFGDPDGEDFAFTKCAADGSFTLSGLPDGDWRITVFDQWNDMLVDGLSTPVRLAGGATKDLGDIAMNQWQTNIYTATFFDQNRDGVRQDTEPGLSLVSTNIRFRDGSFSNFNNTDLSGNAGFNEIFPLFSWYVVETTTTRYKSTGTHVVYDAGGPADSPFPLDASGNPLPCPTGHVCSNTGGNMANTAEQVSLPAALRVPGGRYCAHADCPAGDTAGGSTGRVDPPWVLTEGWQGFSGQNSFIEFGKMPFAAGENGGINGHVVYASTRPFDDPSLLLQLSWEPLIPHVTVNLYQEGTAADGSQSLKLVDTTQTSSWDDWAQGFYPGTNKPYMNCPGQLPAGTATTPGDLFFFTLFNQPNYLDLYNSQHGGPAATALPNNSQFKCYDGMHNWNQVQPAPYDGMYQFPSIIGRNPTTGVPQTPAGVVAGVNGTPGTRPGSNCTICVNNPNDNTPMLPAGKYVVEVVVPPNYELVKEEDKNILIGDTYIAPVTQQFAGLGNVFIIPDQAAVGATYNANNAQNPTQDLGVVPRHEGDTGSVEAFWPCVGASRIVPDYISLFPHSQEVAPFAGATRNLCDRKEVTLTDQASVLAKFYLFTSAHVAAHFTGVITDDFTSEFDPFSPQFGEKFSPANLPVSIKDFNGNEISRVYTDQWGTYNGLNYSTWEVNPPNPTGYAPQMMVTCMNDPGTAGTPDPLFNPSYSQFCYEIPFMPGQTQYMDTPVVPTSAFAGAGYNNPDCAYPALTPAISEVDGDGLGPWVSAAGHTITIHALGDQVVNNYGYSGPSATASPFNQKKVTRHYGFGAAPVGGCSNGNPNAACSSVTVGGIPLHGVSWSDTTITGTVQANVPFCNIQQQAQYGGPGALVRGARVSSALCGELRITAANGIQSIDTVTVTIGGKTPTHVHASDTIQGAIDRAAPGDLIIVDPTFVPSATAALGTSCAGVTAPTATCVAAPSAHHELLLMWKPVRLQGVGAASSIINANTHPAGKLDGWRAQVDCLFGLSTDGTPTGWNNTCAAGWTAFVATPNNPQIDRLPLEATVGWDAGLNGNLAELLQEPSLMGALEGAAITVLSKGADFHGANPWDPTLLAGFPTGTTLLTANNCSTSRTIPTNPFPSSFWCNPSSIDGLSITDSSQGGGGIFVHGWGHNIQIANNRVINNTGTLTGGISVGQGEFPPGYTQGGGVTNVAPGSCQSIAAVSGAGAQLPYCHDLNVNIHNNAITSNSSTGDELFSATPAGAGGVSFCTGSDYYKFNYNWVCGNLSTGDGGGVGHIGFSYNGAIEHNTILFNQSTNPTIAANGGGLLIMGSPDVDPPCSTVDQDCVGATNLIGPSDGAGPGLTINANLIMGNAAESGSGGGLRLQNINGAEVVLFPRTPSQWYSVNVTNNIIANNVAGWDGAGVSMVDALNVNFINNTVMSNDTTASSGVLFNTLGAPIASSQGPCVTDPNTGLPPNPCVTTSTNQPAGLVSIQNSAVLIANLPATITCPPGHYAGTNANNGTCRRVSYPLLANDVFWQNRPFHISVGALGPGTLNQQHVVTLVPTLNQPATGRCVTGASYWDIGVRGDTGPGNHSSTVTLAPSYSILTPGSTGYSTASLHNSTSNPNVVSQYCNGSRVPPENGGMGYQVPPGIADATVPNPIFNLTPAATVDEGNNWINIAWGPLAMTNPVTNVTLGNYAPTATSSVINYIPSSATTNYNEAPSLDFFGNARKTNNAVDAGAVEFGATTGGGGSGGGQGTLSFTSATNGTLTTALGVRTLTFTIPTPRAVVTSVVTVTNSGTGPLQITAENLLLNIGGLYTVPAALNTCSFTTPLAVGGTCTFSVTYATPAARPGFPDIGALAVVNDGSGTIGGSTPLALVAQ
jgi:hypothetical protein